ncbi:hypothetical protein M513_00332 [Trichuris suis]|uniref:Uncharacterized protein n=1 Tax=Trichuris suis TaxID=68888 RepID=A0A085MN43_9BILA|nr:hypothetical protein M513_00332 [Trichuris suis]
MARHKSKNRLLNERKVNYERLMYDSQLNSDIRRCCCRCPGATGQESRFRPVDGYRDLGSVLFNGQCFLSSAKNSMRTGIAGSQDAGCTLFPDKHVAAVLEPLADKCGSGVQSGLSGAQRPPSLPPSRLR